jgi:very-short-patch-repair endonuclease
MTTALPDEARVMAKVRPRPALRRTDRDITDLARPQHGAVTLEQLGNLGLSGRAIRHRVASGRLSRVALGVYAIGHVTERTRLMGATLAIGDGAALSHRSAAALWGLRADHRDVVDITLVGCRTRRAPSGIAVHSGTAVTQEDIGIEAGIPCTTVARTLLDLAAFADRQTTIERAIDRAEELRLFDLAALTDVLARNRRRRGAGRLGAVLEAYAGPALTRNEIEARFAALVQRAALPTPEVNTWIPLAEDGYRPDFLWRDARLIVEVDGRTHHARRRAFEHDRRRDRRLALAGYETRRYAAAEVIRDPRSVAREVAAFLATAHARPTKRR